jgi:hypothetical protein
VTAPPGVLFGADIADVYRLRLPFRVPPITTNEARHRTHYAPQNRAKREVAQAVAVLVRHAGVPKLDRLLVRLVWYAPDYGTRDADGLGLMLKACLDALTPPRDAIPKGAPTLAGTPRKTPLAAKPGAGIIRDDNAEVVPGVAMWIELGSADPRIELELYPLPAVAPRPTRARSPRTRTRPGRVEGNPDAP